MPNAFAISLKNPHMTLGLPQPLGRRLPQGIVALNVAMICVTLVLIGFYVVRVNAATAKGYALRDVERKVDGLKTESLILQDKIATLSSMQNLSSQATALGYVPVERLEFVRPAANSYAMAK